MSRLDAPALLVARDVTIAYGKVAAVRAVSLEIRAGEVVTIVGPNGAGKTTLLAGLMGLLPLQGEVKRFGTTAATPSTVEQLVRAGMGLIPERRELFGSLSVEDNLRLGGFDRWRQGARDCAADLAGVYKLFPRLLKRRGQHAATLSGGERQMLALGRALMARPKLDITQGNKSSCCASSKSSLTPASTASYLFHQALQNAAHWADSSSDRLRFFSALAKKPFTPARSRMPPKA